MRAYNTNQFVNGEIPIVGQDQTLEFNGLTLPTTNTTITLGSDHTQQITDIASESIDCFASREETYATTEHNVVTLLARVDCTIVDGQIVPYECEERPAGLGVTDRITQYIAGVGIRSAVQAHYESLAGSMPIVARQDQAGMNDDSLFFGTENVVSLDKAIVRDSPIIVRGEPTDLQGHHLLSQLRDRSVSTVTQEGDKTYTLSMDKYCARKLTDVEPFTPEKSVVIKPLQGSKAKGVAVYLSPEDRKIYGKKGTITFSKLQSITSQLDHHQVVMEDLKPPIRVETGEGTMGNMILRVFCLVHPSKKSEIIGGAFVVRPELIVHGASNSIAGAILKEGLYDS